MKKFGAMLIVGLFGLGAFAAGPLSTAHAVDSDCTVTVGDLAQIKAIQNDPTLSYSDELAQELSVRRMLLTEVIVCAKGDAQSLQSSLQAATLDKSVVGLQAQLSDKLTDAINFYNIELSEVPEAGIADTQTIAAQLLAWRTANYDPLSGQVSNLILWSQNQALFTAAQNRLDQTKQLVSFLETAAPSSDIDNDFTSAETSLGNAMSENQSAQNALLQLLPPDQSLALIQQSLQSLSDTYQHFFDLSTLIQKLLPTTSN